MIQEAATAIATGAAGNIVAYMLSNRADALREWCALAFRHGTRQLQSEALRALDEDAAALFEQRTTEEEVASRWITFLSSYLDAYPEAADDVGSVASTRGTKISMVGSQTNSGSGTFINGDIYGGVNLGPGRGPARDDG